MEKIKPPKNFTMSRENMKATLEAFRAGRSVADVTQEVFHAISPIVAGWIATFASSRVLVLVMKGFRFVASRASTQGKALSSSKSPAAPRPKSTSTPNSREPITINESMESGSKGGPRSLLLQLNHGKLLAPL